MRKTRLFFDKGLLFGANHLTSYRDRNFENPEKDTIETAFLFSWKLYSGCDNKLRLEKVINDLNVAYKPDVFTVKVVDDDNHIIVDVNPEKFFVNDSDIASEDKNSLPVEKRKQITANSLINDEYTFHIEKEFHGNFRITISEKDFIEEEYEEEMLSIDQTRVKCLEEGCLNKKMILERLAIVDAGVRPVDFD